MVRNGDEIEMDFIRKAVENITVSNKLRVYASIHMEHIISIIELFLKNNKILCYGGTAINNILPAEHRFYETLLDIPDYDFYSTNAIRDLVRLADKLHIAGFTDIEVKSSVVHEGVYKLFIKKIPIADANQLQSDLFNIMYEDSVHYNGISYVSPDYLRLNIYKELSAPKGDISRWEKIYERLLLLNKYHPFKENSKCSHLNFMRKFVADSNVVKTTYTCIRDTLVGEGVVFLGGYACGVYNSDKLDNELNGPDFDVLSMHAHSVAYRIRDALERAGIVNVDIAHKLPIGDGRIGHHHEIRIDNVLVCTIYEPLACYGYNSILVNDKYVNIASIDTMMFYLLSLRYVSKNKYNIDRILCMAQFMIRMMLDKTKNNKNGIFKRFDVECYGNEKTIVELRANRTKTYNKLKHNTDSIEYNTKFFLYNPNDGIVPNYKRESHGTREKSIRREKGRTRTRTRTRKNRNYINTSVTSYGKILNNIL